MKGVETMSKMVVPVSLSYRYDATRKCAKYTLDGIHFMNTGDFCEVCAKAAHGLEPKKDASTRFDMGSDVPEYNASVKSATARLTSVKLADTLEDSIKAYFERVPSTEFWYVIILNDQLIIYKMNAEQFKVFVSKFAKLEGGTVRLPGNNSKVWGWLENNVRD